MIDKIDFAKIANQIIKQKLLSEAIKDESAFNTEDFNIKDYLPKVELTPSAFKENAEKNFDTRLLEQMFASFRGNNFAESITKFNNAIGVVTTPEGIVQYTAQAGAASGTDIYDSMALLSVLQTVLAYDSTAAGTLFEKIAAGLLGGFHRGGSGNFEDVSVGNQTYSIKMLVESGEIKGSMPGLAVNVAIAENGTGVNFLIGIKSNPENSHVLKFIEFVINRDNFFKFCGYEGKEEDLITLLSKSISVKVPAGFNNRKEAGYASIAEWAKIEYRTELRSNPTLFFNALKELKTKNLLYLAGRAKADTGEQRETNALAILLNPPVVSSQLARQFQTELQHYYKSVIGSASSQVGQQQTLIKWIEKRKESIAAWITKLKQYNTKQDWSPEVLASLESYFGKLNDMNENNVFNKLLFLDEMPKIFKIATTKNGDKAALGTGNPSLSYAWDGFARAPDKVQQVRTQMGFGRNIEELFKNAAKLTAKEKVFYTELLNAETVKNSDEYLDALKNNFASPPESLLQAALGQTASKLEESTKPIDLQPQDTTVQFVIKAKTVLNNLTDYNGKQNIPALVINKDFIDKNTEERNISYLKSIEPVFREFHKVRVSLLKYYSGGFVEGIFEAKTNVAKLSTTVSQVVSAEEQKPAVNTKPAAKKPAGKLKESLNESSIDAIIESLFTK